MKRVISLLLAILLTIIMSGCADRRELNNTFDSYDIETVDTTPYVHNINFVFNDVTIDFIEILKENNCNGFLNEVYALQDNTLWFGYSNSERTEEGYMVWNIATVDLESKKINVCYSGEFGLKPETNNSYEQNNNEPNPIDSGFYSDEKIVLTDGAKTVVYDLKTNSATEFYYEDYKYPTQKIKAEIIDNYTIKFSIDEEEKIFNVEQGRKTSKTFTQLFELEDKKNWRDESYLSNLFDKVQIVDGQVYIMCRVSNKYGETHALVFQYDFESNGCKYAFNHFTNDIIGSGFYVVPMIR